jgi:hypothetical protein
LGRLGQELGRRSRRSGRGVEKDKGGKDERWRTKYVG